MIERELKLSVPPRFHPPDLGGVIDGATAVALEPRSLRATYYDTHDLRLVRWGLTLRYRIPEGWTLKLPGGSGSELMARNELQFEGGPRRVPPRALELLRAYTRRDDLEVVARMRTLRRPVELRDETGRRMAEVVDDEVSVLDGHRVAERFRELEIELAEDVDGDELLAATLARMQAEGATTAPPTPKLVRAVGPLALEPPEVDAAPVDESASAGEVVASAIAKSVARFLRHDPGVVLGDDPEDVHQARVALRRLRSDLRTFGPLLDPEWTDHLRAEASWFGGLLGDVRDAEVLHDALMRDAAALTADDGAALGHLVDRLETARAEARVRLLAERRGDRFVDLCQEMVDAARAPRLTAVASEPAEETLPALVARPWRKVRRAARQLDADSPDAELHRLRILTKRLRYASEAVAPATGKRAKRIARGAARLQDVLGAHQDAVIAQDWLRGAAEGASPAEGFAAGEAHARQALAAERTRRQWPKAWRRLRAATDRDWLRHARRAQERHEEVEPQPEPQMDEAAAMIAPPPPEPAPLGPEPGGELPGEGGAVEEAAPGGPAEGREHDAVDHPAGGAPGEPVGELSPAAGGEVADRPPEGGAS